MSTQLHGFASPTLQVAPDQQPAFDRLEAQLRETVNPAAGLEEELFRQLLTSAWQLRRLARWEEAMLADETNPFDDPAAEARLKRFHRYKAAHQRTFDRALKEIRDLQSLRAALEQIEPNLPSAEASADIARRATSAPLARLPILLKAIKIGAKAPETPQLR